MEGAGILDDPIRTTDFMVRLAKRLQDERGVSDSSSLQYLQTLYQLNGAKPFKNLAWTRKIDDIKGRLDGYADSTKMSYLATLVSALSLYKSPVYKKTARLYTSELNKAKEVVSKKPIHEKTEKQAENWVDWDEVIKKKTELASQVKPLLSLNRPLTPREYETVLSHLVLSLYTEMPPRRNKDFMEAFVVKSFRDSLPQNFNYLDLKGKRFIFNKYKTAKVYGQQIVGVPEDLMRTIKNYLKIHPKKDELVIPLLTRSDGSHLSSVNSITRILNRVFGKNVGSSMLRHSYLTSKYGKDTDAARIETERKATAEAMSHSMGLQNEYIKE